MSAKNKATSASKYPRPLRDRVIVTAVQEEEKTAGGLFIPESAKEKPQLGKVIAVGKGVIDPHTGERVPLDVQVGDKILFGKYSGVDIKLDGVDMLILKEDEILAVV